jgi:seryl-tRNA synthetase
MKRISWHVVIGVLVLGGVVGAATLNDFKNAEGQTGCDSIPYDGIRSTCRGNRDGVRDWCKNSSRPISCENLDPSGLTKQIENMKGKIADLKRERDELSSKISSAKDDSERRALEDKKKATEDKIYELEKRVADSESKLSSEKTEINNRIYNGEKCVDHRKEVAKAFESAKSSAKSESDPEIKPIADKLVRHWESEEPNHAGEIRKYQEAVDRCKNMR